jgi:histidinol-phosphate aminotransferase
MSTLAAPRTAPPAVGENVSRLVPYRPGKPIEEVKRELGLTHVTKLASNENSLGPSPFALAALRESAARMHLYPDAACHDLREAVSASLGVPGDHLIFGNGSDDVIHLIGVTYLERGDVLIQADPSFVRYEASAVLNESPCIKVPLLDWTHDLPAMAKHISPQTRVIYVTNPNNPTGTMVTSGDVDAFLARVPERVIVVFDEAYFEYVENAEFPDTLRYVREGRNVIVLRTFSKAYGLAGIRLGYGIARPEIIRHLDQVREPFNVSLLAQTAGVAALKDCEHLNATLAMNRAGKELFYREFEALGLPFAPTEANFVWVDVRRDSKQLFEALLRKGVIVRTGDIFGAPTHIRVTIGTEEENQRFLTALKEEIGR